MSIYNAIPVEAPMIFCTELGNRLLKCVWMEEIAQIAKSILIKNKKHGTQGGQIEATLTSSVEAYEKLKEGLYV